MADLVASSSGKTQIRESLSLRIFFLNPALFTFLRGLLSVGVGTLLILLVCPQNDSVLRQQLQEEARELRSLYQEKVVPQQSLVVSLKGVWGLRDRRDGERAGGMERGP